MATSSSGRIAVAALSVAAAAGMARAQNVPDGDWWTIDRHLAGSRYSPRTGITATNVGSLEESWRFELGGNSTAVPLAVDGTIYVPAGTRVVALDGASGEELWSAKPGAAGNANPMSFADRNGLQHVAIVAGGELVAYSVQEQ